MPQATLSPFPRCTAELLVKGPLTWRHFFNNDPCASRNMPDPVYARAFYQTKEIEGASYTKTLCCFARLSHTGATTRSPQKTGSSAKITLLEMWRTIQVLDGFTKYRFSGKGTYVALRCHMCPCEGNVMNQRQVRLKSVEKASPKSE